MMPTNDDTRGSCGGPVSVITDKLFCNFQMLYVRYFTQSDGTDITWAVYDATTTSIQFRIFDAMIDILGAFRCFFTVVYWHSFIYHKSNRNTTVNSKKIEHSFYKLFTSQCKLGLVVPPIKRKDVDVNYNGRV